MAARGADPPRGSATAGTRRLLARVRDPTAADIRVYRRRAAHSDHPDGGHRRGAGRVDGHRYAVGGAVPTSPPAVRLLRRTFRAGDEPAARRDSGAARYVAGRD